VRRKAAVKLGLEVLGALKGSPEEKAIGESLAVAMVAAGIRLDSCPGDSLVVLYSTPTDWFRFGDPIGTVLKKQRHYLGKRNDPVLVDVLVACSSYYEDYRQRVVKGFIASHKLRDTPMNRNTGRGLWVIAKAPEREAFFWELLKGAVVDPSGVDLLAVMYGTQHLR